MSQIAVLRETLHKMRPEFEMVLPVGGIAIDRLVRTTMNALQTSPRLQECSAQSILSQVMVAAALGLEPDGVLGHGWLVPYRGAAVFVPGYRGYIVLADNAGWTLEGRVVRERDDILVEEGTAPRLEHRPMPFGSVAERGRIVGAYARARALDRPALFSTITVEEIDAIRDASQGYQYAKSKGRPSPWIDFYAAMAEKTAIRGLAKHLPLRVQRAAAVEAMTDRGSRARVVEGEIVEEPIAEAAEPGAAGHTGVLDRLAEAAP